MKLLWFLKKKQKTKVNKKTKQNIHEETISLAQQSSIMPKR